MPSKASPLTNWAGGFNNTSSPYSLDDSELVMVLNMELGADGALTGRPALTRFTTTPASIQPLGYYVREDGTTSLVFATANSTFLLDIETKVQTTIWAREASGFVQYDNKIVLISETGSGGYWENGAFTSTPTMPLGSDIVFYQERFWAFGRKGTSSSTTFWFSDLNVITPAQSIWNWQVNSNFLTVAKGDGQWITSLTADTNALYIGRSSSTWKFTYPGLPSDGTLRCVNVSIGVDNKHSIQPYDNWFLVLNGGFLYQFLNDRYYALNQKKVRFDRRPFTGTLLHETRLSVFGRRAIVSFFGNLYVYNIVTTTWSMWDSPTSLASEFFTIPSTSTTGDSREALAISSDPDVGKRGLWHIQDEPLSVNDVGEQIKGVITTKAYDFGSGVNFKRMTNWNIEAQTALGVEGIATPTTIPGVETTWNQMNTTTWNQLNFGSWNNPLLVFAEYIDDANFPTQVPTLGVFKLAARLKFTRCTFQIFLDFDGTARTSPTRLIGIIPFLMVEANVSKKVT
jgi:hypothetical protein